MAVRPSLRERHVVVMLAQRACVYVYVLVCACVGKTMIAAALDQLGNGGLHLNETCYSQPFNVLRRWQ